MSATHVPSHDRDTRTWSRTLAVAGLAALIGGIIGPGATTATIDTGPRAVFVPITPCRLIDTRPGNDNVGTRTTPLGSGETTTIHVTGTNGNCTIPTDATAIAANVVAVNPTHAGFFTLWPSGVTPRPLTANLNFTAGAPPTPNKIDVKLSTNGRLDIYNLTGTAHLVLDIFGYYADHTHDDRYAQLDHTHPRDTTLDIQSWQVGAFELVPRSSSTFAAFVNDCSRPASTTTFADVPLPLPVGARLLTVDVTMYDGPPATSYSVSLRRSIVDSAGNDVETVGSVFGGEQSNVSVTHTIDLTNTIIPAGADLVGPTSAYHLSLSLGSVDGLNAFCLASVTFDMTP